MRRIIYAALVFAALITLIWLLKLDIRIATFFYRPGHIFVDAWSQFPLWSFLYRYGTIPPNAIWMIALLVLAGGFFFRKLRRWRKLCVFALLLAVLAPGLVVQTLKSTWGRHRPIELTQFGGYNEYREPFEPDLRSPLKKNHGNSFPSGHAAMGFYMLALYFMFGRRTSLLLLGLVYGGFMAFARIAQGGHFLSDVLTSLFIIYITAEALSKILDIDKEQTKKEFPA